MQNRKIIYPKILRNQNYSGNVSKIEQYLQSYSLKKINVPGDGNCLFHSMCIFFRKQGYRQDFMRKLICDYIEKSKELFNPSISSLSEYRSFDEYIKEMRKNGHWGDGICLQAFGLLFKTNVILLMPTGIYHMHTQFKKNVAFVRDGNHYQAAVPNKSS